MKALRLVAVAVVVVILLFFASLVLVNLNDPELDPRLHALFEEPRTVPPAAVAAYKYLFAIAVNEEKDPASVGETWYAHLIENSKASPERKNLEVNSEELGALKVFGLEGERERTIICPTSGSYCAAKLYDERRDQIRDLITRNRILLERFDKLLDFPGYGRGSDLLPSLNAPAIRANDLLKLTGIKLASISALIHEGDPAKARAELLRVQRFYASSLEYPSSVVETLVQLAALRETRTFLESALKENPDFLAKAQTGYRESFEVKIPFSRIADHMKLTELQIMRDLFTWSHDFGFLFKANIASSEGAFSKSIEGALSALPVSGFLLKKNETLNDEFKAFNALSEDSCLKSERECDELKSEQSRWRPLRNPIGRGLLKVIGAGTGYPFQRAYRTYEPLTRPI
jgi:hypothetical protein